MPMQGTRSNPESLRLAEDMTIIIGADASIIDAYRRVLANAPPEHMRVLHARGAAIVFAPTVADALRSHEAALRRGHPLTSHEIIDIDRAYGADSGTAGVYDPALDWLIFPTAMCAIDTEWPVMHELGHALTLEFVRRGAERYAPLLNDLPRDMRDLIHQPPYESSDPHETLRVKVGEMFAEAYVRLVVDNVADIPDLASALIVILTSMEGQRPRHLRSTFDSTTGRTASVTDSAHIRTSGSDLAPTLPHDVTPCASFVARPALVEPREQRPKP